MASSTTKCFVTLTNASPVVALTAGNAGNVGVSFAAPNIAEDMLLVIAAPVNALRFIKGSLSTTSLELQEAWNGATVTNAEVRIATSGAAVSALTAAVRELIGQAPTVGAAEVTFTPYGNLAATTLDAAIRELDDEKVGLASKDQANGFVGITNDWKVRLTNLAGTIVSYLVNAATASRTYTLPDYSGTLATQAGTETLTGKSISGAANTLTAIPNSALVNYSFTLGTTSVSLGGTATTIAGLSLTAPNIGAATGTSLSVSGQASASGFDCGASPGRFVDVFNGGGGANRYGIGMTGAGTGGDPYRMRIMANGQEWASVTASGALLVGLSASVTGAKLEVAGSMSGTTGNFSSNVAVSGDIIAGATTSGIHTGNIDIGNYGNRGNVGNIGCYSGNLQLQNGATGFTGSVLIGTTSPVTGAKLEVAGGLSANNLQLPATQVPSSDPNNLDDYEEGTWTPSLGGTTTYTHQSGRYTKIGNKVHIEGRLVVNAIGTGSTSILSGLPFTSNGSLPTGIIRLGYFAGCANSVVAITGMLQGGGTSVQFYSQTAAGTAMGVNAIFQSGAEIYFAGTYTV